MLSYMDYSNEQGRQHCTAIHTAGELYMLAVLNHPLPTVGALTAHHSGLDLDVDRPRLDLGFTMPKDPLIAAGGIVAHGVDYGVSTRSAAARTASIGPYTASRSARRPTASTASTA